MARVPLESIDLFCGAGGLTAGLERAGWTTLAAIDFDRDSAKTLRATQAERIRIESSRRYYLDKCKIIEADIATLKRNDIVPKHVSPDWRPTLLAGGPPCQPFSSAGKQKGLSDPRGTLFLEFVRLASELRPRFILFENVRGLLTARCQSGEPGGVLRAVQQSFEDIGYACRFSMLNSADFGAPQRRVRLFMLGSAEYELPDFPEPTHTENQMEAKLFGLKSWYSLGEFLATQPKPVEEDIVRPTASRRDALEQLTPGSGLKANGIVEANRPSGHWGYRQDCFVADPAIPGRTIRAATTPDWIRDDNGQLRRLTWRECAASQGFPLNWHFVGNRASLFRQIGNAVEGRVAEALGHALARHAVKAKRAKPTSPPWPSYFSVRMLYTAKEEAVNGGHRARSKARTKAGRT